MSVDRQDFSRVIKEQQGGIAPQMWSIRFNPGTIGLALNSPYELPINPCDMLWMPSTYDKSYGPNPFQTTDLSIFGFCVDPLVAGQNIWDVFELNPSINNQRAPIFGLRFNSPNNPWILWGLSTMLQPRNWEGPGPATFTVPTGQGGCMRSIVGPITRLWIQFYQWANVGGGYDPTISQIVLMSMLGFGQESIDSSQNITDGTRIALSPGPTIRNTSVSGSTYLTPQLNTNELLQMNARAAAAAGAPIPTAVAPPVGGK